MIMCEECERDFDPKDVDHVLNAAYPVCAACHLDMWVQEEADGTWSELEKS